MPKKSIVFLLGWQPLFQSSPISPRRTSLFRDDLLSQGRQNRAFETPLLALSNVERTVSILLVETSASACKTLQLKAILKFPSRTL